VALGHHYRLSFVMRCGKFSSDCRPEAKHVLLVTDFIFGAAKAISVNIQFLTSVVC